MTSNRRQLLHENIREEIKAIAWKQIAQTGASSLSLGSIAREMVLTTPALYRYFSSRNDLVSALIQDAYRSFTAALEQARDSLPPEEHAGRLLALFSAYRQWALSHPEPYSLLFGNPVPGYTLTAEAGQAGDHSFQVLLSVIQAADQAGKLSGTLQKITHTPALDAQLTALENSGETQSPQVIHLALSAWSFIHGITSLELNQQYQVILADHTDDFAQIEIRRFMQAVGFE